MLGKQNLLSGILGFLWLPAYSLNIIGNRVNKTCSVESVTLFKFFFSGCDFDFPNFLENGVVVFGTTLKFSVMTYCVALPTSWIYCIY